MVTVGILPLVVMAQADIDTISTREEHFIDEVVVKARKTSSSVSSSQPTQNMNREQLDALGIQSVADAVKRFAGATVRDYGGIGGLKTVSIRSFGTSHTGISYDGVTVSNCQAGQIDLGRFSLDNVEELSLTVGQEGDMLQSARGYASAGVLSIRTERPFFTDGKKDMWQVQMRAGSFGYVTPSLRYTRKLSERTSCMIEGDYMRADGVYPFKLTNGQEVTKERRHNSDINSWHIEANLFHTFRDSSRLSIKSYYYDSERGLPGGVILYNPSAHERLWDEDFFTQMTYDKRFSTRWQLRSSAKYNHAWNRYQDKSISDEDGVLTEVNRQDEYYLSVTALYTPCENISVSLAQDGVVNKLRNNLPQCPFPTRYTALTALNVSYKLSWLTAQGVLMNTYATEEVKSGDAPDDQHRLSPSFSLIFRPWQSQRLFMRFSYKNTFRLPSFNDMYYFRIGNKALRPEKVSGYNVGITYERSSFTCFDYLTFTADGYINRVTDKIVAIPTTYVWKMSNYGKVNITGVDLTMSTGVSLWDNTAIHLTGTYTYQKAIDRTNSSAKNYKHQLPYTPKHSGTLGAHLQLPWLNVGYTAMAVSHRYTLAQNSKANEVKGYTEHTMTLSRDFHLWNAEWRVQGEVVNFTDAQYDVIRYYPMPGRSYRLTLRAKI